MTILDKIIANKKLELPELLGALPKFHTLEKQRPSLYETLIYDKQLQVIAEMKRASPSKGDIATGVDPVQQALTYEKAGAACISVLTERKFFKGSYQDLNAVANAVAIPVLCKDFIIHEVQIDYAKAAGASVILLIVAALTDEELQSLYSYATKSDLEVLVEVHDVEELERALLIDAKIIGVNNRNLKTFEVDLKQTEKISSALNRSDIAFISESGIWNSDDASQVAGFGAKAVLVGESLMRSEHVAENLQALQVPIPMKVGESQ
ncbi:indole-3-glycerol phosphate synthase TrpC [Lysinibacillus sp. 54212]|uniref:indole-3-glycerol phosphate synthase TrpC n=1 Tax=Lysinibacillus sp. 54212 TaxID=3119829 RepID=UPI002FCA917D